MTNRARRKARPSHGVMQMTHLELHSDLSYCTVDGHLIFLDIQNDRYFRLSEHMEAALVTFLHEGEDSCSSVHRLIERKILVEVAAGADRTAVSFKELPTHSAMEDAAHARRLSLGELLDTFAIVFSAQRQLKTRSLKQTIGNLASYRERRTAPSLPTGRSDGDTEAAAAAFRSARLYVPIDTCCLLDSIAMVRFLAKRALHADLVFGVARDPFSAHCWVQHGGTVLNDALGHTLAFTPIRVI